MSTAVRSLLVVLAIGSLPALSADDLTVLPRRNAPVQPGQLLLTNLKRQCYAASDRRRANYESLKSPAECRRYQERMRAFFLNQIGGLPKRTPLNAKVVGKLSGDGFRVEKVIYESQPQHHVTALLYLPATKPPWPGVLVPCGHSHNGKASGSYQRIAMLLAQNGLAALCYDPVGQGERYQVLSPIPRKTFRGFKRRPPHPRVQYLCTTEHTLMDVGSILVGRNTARYRIWDGMRGIDYLLSRPDIDPKRIGCTGISGGGTLTSYLMALDDRIRCAAPGCYLTTFRRLIDSSGPQDGEQNIFRQLAYGMGEAEYVLMRAPKPTLLLAGTRDRTFDVVGTWSVFRDAKRFYSRLGFPERVDLAEPDVPHGFPKELRVAATRWMRRWLLKIDDAITEPDLTVFSEHDIQCSPDGQVMLVPAERSVFDLNADYERQLASRRKQLWSTATRDDLRQRIRNLTGSRHLADIPHLHAAKTADIARDGYRIEKLLLTRTGGIPLPALLFVPPKPDGRPCLYLNGAGKQADAAAGGPIEKLVRQGHRVLAIDLSGIGETERRDNRRIGWTTGLFGPDYHEFMLAYLLGKSFVGIRTEDILAGARFLRETSSTGKQPSRIDLVGIGQAGIPALHAAALEPKLFASLMLKTTPSSWSKIVRTPVTSNQLVGTVHAALTVYDLPDLIKLAEPKTPVTIQPAP